MKFTVRPFVFETNSSMNHAYATLSVTEFDRWMKGDHYLYLGGDDYATDENNNKISSGRLYTLEEAFSFLKKNDKRYTYIKNANDVPEDNILDDLECFGFFKYDRCKYDDGIDINEPSKNYSITRSYYDY